MIGSRRTVDFENAAVIELEKQVENLRAQYGGAQRERDQARQQLAAVQVENVRLRAVEREAEKMRNRLQQLEAFATSLNGIRPMGGGA